MTPPGTSLKRFSIRAIVAEAHDYDSYCCKLEEARALLDRYLGRVKDGSAIEELMVSRQMTREPREYSKASFVAIAAQQLYDNGVNLRPGQTVEYVITDTEASVPNDRVRAFALWEGWVIRRDFRDAEGLRKHHEHVGSKRAGRAWHA
jgi:DNA polymerase elongation subunit (family B)